MTSLCEMGFDELRVHLGNAAYQLWSRMPEPKLDYIQWYYGTRKQSLSETLEGVRLLNEKAA